MVMVCMFQAVCQLFFCIDLQGLALRYGLACTACTSARLGTVSNAGIPLASAGLTVGL